MSRLRSSMILLGICVAALLVGVLRLASERATLPTGSSYSTQADGAMGLYEWAAALGGSPSRLQDARLRPDSSQASTTTLLVMQPETLITETVRDEFDAVPDEGGTLVVAGDSLPWLLYVRSLGVTVEPIRDSGSSANTPDSTLAVPGSFRYRVRADDGTPLLVLPSGDWVAMRTPYSQGSLVVITSAAPLTNAALNSDDTARFAYREVLSGVANGGAVVFDEAHHSFAPAASETATVDRVLFSTAGGRALIYAAMLIFLYLLLSGRRLGPPIPARSPTETRRTMYEHVQMLANLYRRAGQFGTLRAAFDRHYKRELARGGGGSPKTAAALAEALARIGTARNESDLIAAVAAAEPEA
jgi:hypothetical protein